MSDVSIKISFSKSDIKPYLVNELVDNEEYFERIILHADSVVDDFGF